MADQQTNQYVDFPVWNQTIPKEGPRTIPFTFDFTALSAYSVDLQNQQSRGFIQSVQSVYCRNPGSVAVSIKFGAGANQQIDFPPQSAGYLPVMVQNPIKFTATSVGGDSSVLVLLCNVPMPASIWPLVAYIPPTLAGLLQVSDAALEAGISGGLFQARQFVTDDNDNTVPRFIAGGNDTGTVTALGTTTILAADVNFGLAVTSINIGLSGNASMAAAGVLTVKLQRAGIQMWNWTVFLDPATPVHGVIPLCDVAGLNYLFTAKNQALEINLSAALAAGSLWYNIGGMKTATIR